MISTNRSRSDSKLKKHVCIGVLTSIALLFGAQRASAAASGPSTPAERLAEQIQRKAEEAGIAQTPEYLAYNINEEAEALVEIMSAAGYTVDGTVFSPEEIQDALMKFIRKAKVPKALVAELLNYQLKLLRTPQLEETESAVVATTALLLYPYMQQAQLCTGASDDINGLFCGYTFKSPGVNQDSAVSHPDGVVKELLEPAYGTELRDVMEMVGVRTPSQAGAETPAGGNSSNQSAQASGCERKDPNLATIGQAGAGIFAIPLIAAGTAGSLVPVVGPFLATSLGGLGVLAGTYSLIYGNAETTLSQPLCTAREPINSTVAIANAYVPYRLNYGIGYVGRIGVQSH